MIRNINTTCGCQGIGIKEYTAFELLQEEKRFYRFIVFHEKNHGIDNKYQFILTLDLCLVYNL